MMKLILKLFFAVCLLFSFTSLVGRNIRAMDCSSERIDNLTYRITLKVYTDYSLLNDTAEAPLDITVGIVDADTDNNLILHGTIIPSITSKKEVIPLLVDENTYVFDFSFPASGVYRIGVLGSFRDDEVLNLNLEQSNPEQIFIEHFIFIDPLQVINSSPIFNSIPIVNHDEVDSKITYDGGAVDPNGDSLSYELIVPKGNQGLEIDEYVTLDDLSVAGLSSVFNLDSITGIVTWDTPLSDGKYSIAIRVSEFRSMVRIGYSERDIQFIVNGTVNSVEESISELAFLYPNPTDEEFYLSALSPILETTVFDSKGMVVSNQLYENKNEVILSLKGDTGVYFVDVRTVSGKRVYKILKGK